MPSCSILLKDTTKYVLDHLWPEWKIPIQRSHINRTERNPSGTEKIERLMRIKFELEAMVRNFKDIVPVPKLKEILERREE